MAHILWRVFRRDVWASIFCKINFFNMNNLEFLRKIEQLDAHLQEIKAFAISIGAKEEAFSAVDEKWEEFKGIARKRASGGILSPHQNGQTDDGEFIVPNRG